MYEYIMEFYGALQSDPSWAFLCEGQHPVYWEPKL